VPETEAASELRVMVGSEERSLYYHNDRCSQGVIDDIFHWNEYPIIGNRQPKTIVDIGANVGMATLWFAMHYLKAEIHAYEPSLESFDLLQRNTGGLNVVCHKAAVSDYCGAAELRRGMVSVCNSLFKTAHHECGAEIIHVEHAGDVILSLGPDILKIDAEGAEIGILESIGRHLADIGIVYVEYHRERYRHQIEEMFRATHHLARGKIRHQNQGVLTYVKEGWLGEEVDAWSVGP
jgi:FkbM family methyltransferase